MSQSMIGIWSSHFVLFAAVCVSVSAATWDDSTFVTISWGINPVSGHAPPAAQSNLLNRQTALYHSTNGIDYAFSLETFTNTWSIALLDAGEGEWLDDLGWIQSQWFDSSPMLWNASETGELYVLGKVTRPVNALGDWSALAPERQRQTTMFAHYTNLWASHRTATLVRNLRTGKTHALIGEPGLTNEVVTANGTVPLPALCGYSPMTIIDLLWPSTNFGYPSDTRTYNYVDLVVSTPSRKVYIGPQIPPYCIWMADFGLTREELAQYPASRVQAAFEARVHPSDKSLDATLLLLQ